MKIIAVANSKGGINKTTLARNLAIALQAKSLLDQDKNQNCIRWSAMRDNLNPELPQLKVISALGSKERLVELLNEEYEENKILIIDCAGADTDLTRAALSVSDIVLCPCSEDFDTISSTAKFIEIIHNIESNIEKKLNVHLIKALESPIKTKFPQVENLSQHANWPVLNAPVSKRQCYKNAVSLGLGITEHKKSTVAVQTEFKALVAEIQTLINKTK